MILKKGSKAGIVCCSNGQPLKQKATVEKLERTLSDIGLVPVFSNCIYAENENSAFRGTAKERAESLMHFYREGDIQAIFDISGGDIANEILPYLDFELIAQSEKSFWGYSDLTTIINAIYTKTGKASVLYQVRNLVGKDSERQIRDFSNTMLYGMNDLFSFRYDFVQKKYMCGVVVGGNIRCLLKLAGTEYWPQMENKILLLESLGGTVPQMVTYLSQLQQMRVFDKINGVLLGTFTQMERERCTPDITELVKRYAGNDIPIAKTNEIGHGSNSKGIVIGAEIQIDAGE